MGYGAAPFLTKPTRSPGPLPKCEPKPAAWFQPSALDVDQSDKVLLVPCHSARAGEAEPVPAVAGCTRVRHCPHWLRSGWHAAASATISTPSRGAAGPIENPKSAQRAHTRLLQMHNARRAT